MCAQHVLSYYLMQVPWLGLLSEPGRIGPPQPRHQAPTWQTRAQGKVLKETVHRISITIKSTLTQGWIKSCLWE